MFRLPLRTTKLPRNLQLVKSYSFSPKGSYKTEDSTVETDEILSDNNPWSPTLFTDPVKVRKPGRLTSIKLPENYRLSYHPIYEAPASKYVGLLKRVTIGVSVIGCYISHLIYQAPLFDNSYATGVLIACAIPAVITQYKTRNYVTRIFRLYDKSKPQTLDNLISDENLIFEKLRPTGGKTYNQLIRVTDNKSLKLTKEPKLPFFSPYSTWEDTDPQTKITRKHYIVDDVGGLKMDRIWGIVEKNSFIDNGRYIEPKSK